jgi:hypothetical protein
MDMLTVFFFFPLMTPREQLSRFKTSTSVHCCAENVFLCGYQMKNGTPAYRKRDRYRSGKDLMPIEDILLEESTERDTVIGVR